MQWEVLPVSVSGWQYRNEGGSSLVFCSASSPCVLKLSKPQLLSLHQARASAAAVMEAQRQQTARRLAHSRLLLRLLGAEAAAGSGGADVGRLVWLPLRAACELLQRAERCRPRSASSSRSPASALLNC